MTKILDYEQMNEILNNLDTNIIKKEEPIGYTTFNYPINHYTYGNGPYHVILIAGTHASELISNVFLINFMKELSNGKINIDKNEYTIHFIPIVNPEGTIIVTSAIRNIIKNTDDESKEQLACMTYYFNSKLEDDYAEKYNYKSIKLHQHMFRYATPDIIDEKHKELKEHIKYLINKDNIPDGSLINWSSNGNGIDLNANIEFGEYLDKINNAKKNNQTLYNSSITRLNTISCTTPGPLGCPTIDFPFKEEPENTALWNLYNNIKNNYKLIGGIIYHSCGNVIYYLDEMKEYNPWNKLFSIDDIAYNKEVAKKYAEITNYKLGTPNTYTTMDAKIKSIVPGTLLVELGGIRSTPLSQFIDYYPKSFYTETIELNTKAIPIVIEEMKKQYIRRK